MLKKIKPPSELNKRLKDNENLYQALARNLPHGKLLIFDSDLRFILAEGTALKNFNQSKEELEGHFITDVIEERMLKIKMPHFKAALQGKTENFEIQDSDGEWYQCTTSPLKNNKGEVQGGMAVYFNIDRLKRAELELKERMMELKMGEEKMKQAEKNMESKLQELTQLNERLKKEVGLRREIEKNLQAYTTELKIKNQELEQFAYVASHDLQEPLRMVSSFTQLLEKRYGDKLGEEGKEFIDFAVEGAHRMQKLINDLLDYSRVGRISHFVMLDFNLALGDVLHNLSEKIRETEALIDSNILPTVYADRTQVIQLFQNLISNALKFKQSGRRPEIRVKVKDEKDHWLFSVSDNGIGFDMKHEKQIFQIFQRLHSKDSIPGTGIGLALVKKIVESHGGEVWAESKPGQGANFYFTFKKENKALD